MAQASQQRSQAETLTNLAHQGASTFIGGNIIGGVGVTGILIVGAALGIGVLFEKSEVLITLTVLGFLLIVFAGSLYLMRKMLENNLLIKFVDGQKEVLVTYTAKLREGTVNADDVLNLLKSYNPLLAGLFQSHFEQDPRQGVRAGAQEVEATAEHTC